MTAWAPLPAGPFRVVYADPPWSLTGGKNGNGGFSASVAPNAHYDVVKTREIATLPVESVCAADAFLFLWAVNGMLVDGLWLMQQWGFRYVNNICWRKTSGYGIGRYIRGAHELCLFGVRGAPGFSGDQPQSVFEAPRGRHSQKPEGFREVVERISGAGPYLELFARAHEPRAGWEFWGNQSAPRFEGVAASALDTTVVNS